MSSIISLLNRRRRQVQPVCRYRYEALCSGNRGQTDRRSYCRENSVWISTVRDLAALDSAVDHDCCRIESGPPELCARSQDFRVISRHHTRAGQCQSGVCREPILQTSSKSSKITDECSGVGYRQTCIGELSECIDDQQVDRRPSTVDRRWMNVGFDRYRGDRHRLRSQFSDLPHSRFDHSRSDRSTPLLHSLIVPIATPRHIATTTCDMFDTRTVFFTSEVAIDMVVFFEVLFVLASVAMAWFAIYVIYRLIRDDRQ